MLSHEPLGDRGILGLVVACDFFHKEIEIASPGMDGDIAQQTFGIDQKLTLNTLN